MLKSMNGNTLRQEKKQKLKGRDFHDDNKYEEQAEQWAQEEYRRKWRRKFK